MPEKAEVIAMIAALQQQVDEQSDEAERQSHELDEAIQPWDTYHEALDKIGTWMNESMPIIGEELVTTNPNLVQRQLREHQVRETVK